MEPNYKINNLGIMIDNSRNAVMRPEAVKTMIECLEKMGYNTLMLYTEDTYEIQSEPYFGHMRGRYSKEELKELDAYAASHGIELMPCIQTLAHLNGLMSWKQYREIRDCDDILCADQEEVYQLIDKMFQTLSDCFTSRTVNIGMDEAERIGLGNHLKKYGMQNRLEILLRHLNRVSSIADKYGFKLLMWGDMFFKLADAECYDKESFLNQVKETIPKNVTLIYWDYYFTKKEHYDQQFERFQQIQQNVWFAGGAWTWSGFAPHNDYSLRISKSAIESCHEHGVESIIITLWGDDGGETSRFSVLPALYACSCFAKGNYDMATIQKGFEELFGIPFESFMLLDLPNTPNTEKNTHNPEKYMLYNDCLMGRFDCTVSENAGKLYADAGAKLKFYATNPTFGKLFSTLEKLCYVLELKYDIGLRTRKAYENKNNEELALMVNDYQELQLRLEDFYSAFEDQWMSENKPHGFEIQDIRLGGLIRRINHATKRIEKYLSGDISSIEELEVPMLSCFGDPIEGNGKTVYCNDWQKIVTVNVV